MAAKAAMEGRLADSLWYSEILYVWNGVPLDATKDENWNRVLNLPFQVAQQSDGPQALDEILVEMGPLLNIAKLPLLAALSDHFLRSDLKPALAERYASEAESVVKQAPNPSDLLLVRPVCQLTMAYAYEGKGDLAKQKAAECLALADKASDVSAKNLANAANVMAHLAANNLVAAESSLEYVLANSPQDPEFHLQLAIALVSKDQYEKGVAEFNQAIKLIEGKRDVNAEAFAFARMALALGSIGSAQHKTQQLEYLKSAQEHYKQANNASQEAAVDIFIGEYYVKADDHNAAVTYFEQAQSLGQQAHDAQTSAQAASQLGTVYNALHDYQKAREFHGAQRPPTMIGATRLRSHDSGASRTGPASTRKLRRRAHELS